MNIENLSKLITTLATIPDEQFSMDSWGSPRLHDCETCGCIGGWAFALSGLERSAYGGFISTPARYWLDLTDEQASALFWPDYWYSGKYTRSQAIAVLCNLQDTGVVDWDKCTTHEIKD